METHPRYLDALLHTVPQVLRHRTCLYVGAHPNGGMAFIPELREAKYRLTIIEAHRPNVDVIAGLLHDSEEIFHEDVRPWQPSRMYDLVIWWHGPEHISAAERDPCIDKLAKCARDWCVIAGPWGTYKQGAAYGNPFEAHVSELEPGWFQQRGWNVQTVGERSVPGGQVVAWKGPACRG